MAWIFELIIGRLSGALAGLVDRFYRKTAPWGYLTIFVIPLAMILGLIWYHRGE